MNTDMAVVGGGPIGLTTARIAAELGADVTLFERKQEGDEPSCCTGLVSPQTLPTLGVSSASILRDISAVRIHLPSRRWIDLRADDVKAVVIDRRTLEAELLALARQAGVNICFGTEVIGAEQGRLTIRSGRQTQTITATIIIGADGSRSRVADWFSLGQPAHVVTAAQVELEEIPTRPDQVDVFVGQNVSPGFYGWSVAAEEGITRIGLGVMPSHSPAPFLDRLLTEHRGTDIRIRARSAGLIPVSPSPRSAAKGVLLVGDAAGHVKPLSGGGLYTGGLCARIAGKTAARTVGSGSKAPDLMAAYPHRCLEAIGRELAFGRSIRHHLAQLTDEDMEAAVAVADDPQLLQFLADHADIDHFHQLPDLIASEPRLWTTLLCIIPVLGHLAG